MEHVKLVVYRSCTWREKRDVLEAFWRRGSTPTSRIGAAALEYGYYAVICLAIVVIELTVLAAAIFSQGSWTGWLAVAGDAFVAWSTWWALVRYRALKPRSAS